MTNSHNRGGKNGSQAERYFNNHSPQHVSGSGGGGKRTSNGGNGGRGPKSPSSNYFRSISSSSAIPIVQPTTPPCSKGGNYYSTSSPSGRHNSFNQANYQRSSPGGASFNNFPGSGSPPNFSHFAGSKYYDAPAPTALPKPPVHWTSSTSSSIMVASALSTPKTGKATTMSIATKQAASGKAASSSFASSPSSTSRSKAKSVKPTMSCAAAAAKANRNVDFAHNLKMVLNVQA